MTVGLDLPSSTFYPHPGREGKEIPGAKSSSQTSTNKGLATKNRKCSKKHDPSSSSASGFSRKSQPRTAHSSLTQTSMSTEDSPHQTNSVPRNSNECDMTTTSSSGRRNFSSRSHHLPHLELDLCQEDFSSSSMSLFPSLLSSSKRSLGRVSRFIVSSSLTSNMILLIFCTLLVSQSFEPTTGYTTHRNTRSDAPRLEILPSGEEQTIQAGKSFVFNCMGVGENTRLYSDLTWYNPRDEVIRSNNDYSVTLTNIGGKKMLVFKNPKAQDEGMYTCKGRFQNTQSLETRVNIRVYEGITWEDCPIEQALIKGHEQEKIRCTASSKPKADITWLKDEQTIDSQRYVTEFDGIRIRGSSAEGDSGVYTVMAAVSEVGLLDIRTIVVQTHVKPEIIDMPDFSQAVEGDKAKLSCRAHAIPHAVYSWFDPNRRNLSLIPGYLVNSESGDLIIDSVDKHRDRGDFKCIASNAAGSDERQVNMKITTRPVITRLDHASAVEGLEASVTCVATGNPPPRLSFRKEGEDRELYSGQQRIRLLSSDGEQASTLTLKISQVDRSDSGLYLCRAENVAGIKDQSAHLEIEFKPDLSRTPTVVKSWSGNVVNITCLAEAIPNATIKWYDSKSRLFENDGRDPRYRIYSSIGESRLQVICRDNTVYTNYRCQANNLHGDSEVHIALQEAFVPGLVETPATVKKSPQSISFSFPAPRNDGGLPITRYHVKYNEVHEGHIMPESWIRYSWPANSPYYFLNGLKAKTLYEFRFTAENEVGQGPESEPIREELPLESQPEPVTIIQDDPARDPNSGDVLSRYSRSFTLKWAEPQDNGKRIESYDIKWYRVKKSEYFGDWTPDESSGSSMFASMTPGDELTYDLRGLQPSTYYRVEISAKNHLGASHPSYLVFKTANFTDVEDLDFEGGYNESSLNLISAAQVRLLMIIFVTVLVLFFIIMDVICCCSFNTGLIHWVVHCCSGPSSKASASSSTRRNLRSGSNSSVEGEKEDPMGGFDDHVDKPLNRHLHHHQQYQQQAVLSTAVSHQNAQHHHQNNGHQHHNLPAVQTTPIVASIDPSLGSVV